MKKNKFILILLALLFIQPSSAETDISYDWLEFDTYYSSNDGVLKAAGSKSISDYFYVVTSVSRGFKKHPNTDVINNKISRTLITGLLGFHLNMTEKTDFYLEIGLEHSKLSYPVFHSQQNIYRNIDASDTETILKLGTRTKFNEKFELISTITHVDNDYPLVGLTELNEYGELILKNTNRFDSHDADLNFKLLYNVSDYSSLTFGVSSSDKDGLFSLGWRKSW